MTTLQEFLKRIESHRLYPGKVDSKYRPVYFALATAGEAGELANIMKKNWRQGNLFLRRHDTVSELADVGNYLFMFAQEMGVDLLQAMNDKLDEVEKREEWKNGYNGTSDSGARHSVVPS